MKKRPGLSKQSLWLMGAALTIALSIGAVACGSDSAVPVEPAPTATPSPTPAGGLDWPEAHDQPTATPGTTPATAATSPADPAPTTGPAAIVDPTATTGPAATADPTPTEEPSAPPVLIGWRTDLPTGPSMGDVAPNTPVLLRDGSTATLEEVAAGKPVLLYFFATW